MSEQPPRFIAPTTKAAIEHGDLFMPRFDSHGLIPAVATDAETGEMLMMAWMNAEALSLTLESGEAHFWTRSRQRIWKKGEESGNVLRVKSVLTDCDQDVVWLKVQVAGNAVACHTGARSCFYRVVEASAETDGPDRWRLVPADKT